MKDQLFGQRVAWCLHKYLSFATLLSAGRDSIRLERIPSISRTLPGGRTRCSRMQSRKSLGANWNDRRRWGDRMRSLRFLDSTMARKFFLTFSFPSCVRFFFFFSSLFRSPSQRIYSLKCHEQRSISYRSEKDDNTRPYHRRIKMTGRKIEREKCCEKEKFLHQFIVSLHQFSTLRDFKCIGRYLLAFNALTSLLASL